MRPRSESSMMYAPCHKTRPCALRPTPCTRPTTDGVACVVSTRTTSLCFLCCVFGLLVSECGLDRARALFVLSGGDGKATQHTQHTAHSTARTSPRLCSMTSRLLGAIGASVLGWSLLVNRCIVRSCEVFVCCALWCAREGGGCF